MNYEIYAKEVVSLYPICNPEIKFIRHSENMTYKIIDKLNGKSYLLRIHNASTSGLSGDQHTFDGVKSEIEFLRYLSSSKLVKVQKPIVNNQGKYITSYSHSDIDHSCFATILEWIEGPTLTLEEDNIEEIVFNIGQTLANFHKVSMNFKPTKDFFRPAYGLDRLEISINELEFGVEAGVFSREQYKLMKQVADIVKDKIKILDEKSNSWGIIHADLQLGNIILNDSQPVLIDFGLSGFGHYLFDLGSGVSMVKSNLRESFLKGYDSKGKISSEDIKYIECLIFADVFISYMLFIHDERHRKWIKEDVQNMCDNLCEKFINGEEVLYLF